MADDNSQQDIDYPGYKLSMANITAGVRHATRYIKPLEKFTVEPRISFERLVFGLGIGVTLVVIYGLILTKLGARFKYVGPWVILMAIASAILLLLYVLPSRDRSLLSSIMSLAGFQLTEKARLATSKNNRFSGIGIKSCSEDGYLEFNDGMVGRLYRVEGQISRSVLPAVADAAATVRHHYSIQRSESTQETLITSVKPVDVRSKKKYLRDLYFDASEAEREGDKTAEWTKAYANMIYGVIEDNMEQDDTQLFQTLLIRDEDETSLKKSLRVFEDWCGRGLYARAEAVKSDAEVARLLSGLAMLSRQGLSEITGEDETAEMAIGVSDVRVEERREDEDEDEDEVSE